MLIKKLIFIFIRYNKELQEININNNHVNYVFISVDKSIILNLQ